MLGDSLCDELRVGLRVLHLEDVELNGLARQLLEVGAEAVRLCAAASDDDSGARGVNVHDDALGAAFNVDARNAGAVEGLLDHPPDLDVFANEVCVALARLVRVSEPLRAVVGGYSESEPGRVDLLAH